MEKSRHVTFAYGQGKGPFLLLALQRHLINLDPDPDPVIVTRRRLLPQTQRNIQHHIFG